jgi:hypothetical protein
MKDDKVNKTPVLFDAKKIDSVFCESASSTRSTMSQGNHSIEMTTIGNESNGFDAEKIGYPDLSQPPGSDDFLILTKVEKLMPSDFSTEVRPRLDAKHYFKNIHVLLDLEKLTTSEIMDTMIRKVCHENNQKYDSNA